MTIQLSRSERAILSALNEAPDKALRHEAAREASKLTVTGYYRMRSRMMARKLIAWTDDACAIQITFGGLRAIDATA